MVATVPVYDAQKAQAGGPSNARFGTPDYRNVMGNKLSSQPNRLGEIVTQVVLNFQEDVNKTRVDDAINQANKALYDLTYSDENGYLNQLGGNALDRKSGKSLDQEYGESYQKELQKIADGLGNDYQREMFTSWTNKSMLKFQEGVKQHEIKQYFSYKESVSNAAIANSQEDIKLNYDNQDVLTMSVNSINSTITDLGQSKGWSELEIAIAKKQATSGALGVAFTTALDKGEVVVAENILDQHSEHFTADDLVKYRRVFETVKSQRLGVETANSILVGLNNESGSNANSINGIYGRMVNVESGGKQFDKYGEPLTSAKGAQGAGQLLMSTAIETAKKHSVEWDVEKFRNDKEYNLMLGRLYFSDMLSYFKGYVNYAVAAYNGGPGRVVKALKSAKSLNKDWFTLLPKETRNYVKLVVGSENQKEAVISLDEQEEKAKATLNERLSDNPIALAAAQDYTKTHFAAQKEKEKVYKERLSITAMQWVIDNSGAPLTAMPSQITSNLYVNPALWTEIINFHERWNAPPTTENYEVYAKLLDEDYLKSLSQDYLMKHLSFLTEDSRKLFLQKHYLLNHPEPGGAKDPNVIYSSAMQKQLQHWSFTLGFMKDKKRISKYEWILHDYIRKKQLDQGRRFSEQEVKTLVDEFFTTRSDVDRYGNPDGLLLYDAPKKTEYWIATEQALRDSGEVVTEGKTAAVYYELIKQLNLEKSEKIKSNPDFYQYLQPSIDLSTLSGGD